MNPAAPVHLLCPCLSCAVSLPQLCCVPASAALCPCLSCAASLHILCPCLSCVLVLCMTAAACQLTAPLATHPCKTPTAVSAAQQWPPLRGQHDVMPGRQTLLELQCGGNVASTHAMLLTISYGIEESANILTLLPPPLLQNPYCCERRSTNGHAFMGSMTQGLGENRFLINGGYQPRISLKHNTWQRWRFLYSGAKVCVTCYVILCHFLCLCSTTCSPVEVFTS
jgi:hypothetical protein